MAWISNNIQGATLPAGQFNKRDAPGPTLPPDAKRVRTDYGPPGRFDDKGGSDGPLGPLLSSGRNPGALTDAERLQSTQTSKTLAINTVRYFPGLRLPSLQGQADLILNKTFMPNDVVFNLRCTEKMVSRKFCMGPATGASTLLLYSVNLATVNHIITGLQLLIIRSYGNFQVQHRLNAHGFQLDDFYNMQRRKMYIDRNFVKFSETDPTLKCWYDFFTALMYDSNGQGKTDSFNEFLRAVFDQVSGYTYMPIESDELMPPDSQQKNYLRFRSVLERMCFEFIFTYCRPVGVFVGSDRQGGEHLEVPNPAAFAPNDYVGVVQVAGKNIATSNMWMFSSDNKEMVCGGDELGFALKWKKYKAYDEEDHTTQHNDLLSFQLSSNPRTGVLDRAKNPQHEVALREQPQNFCDAEQNFGIWLFTPCIYRCLLRKLLTGSGGKEQVFSSHFAKFCIANQMSRHMNIEAGDENVAANARCAERALPLEVFLRFGHRKVHVPYCGAVPTPLGAGGGGGGGGVAGAGGGGAGQPQPQARQGAANIADVVPAAPEVRPAAPKVKATRVRVAAPDVGKEKEAEPGNSLQEKKKDTEK